MCMFYSPTWSSVVVQWIIFPSYWLPPCLEYWCPLLESPQEILPISHAKSACWSRKSTWSESLSLNSPFAFDASPFCLTRIWSCKIEDRYWILNTRVSALSICRCSQALSAKEYDLSTHSRFYRWFASFGILFRNTLSIFSCLNLFGRNLSQALWCPSQLIRFDG